MRIAFHAPLKAPDHPVPSGDRQLARHLVLALSRAGHDVTLASRLRTFDGVGDPLRQRRLAALGEHLAARLVARYRRQSPPDLWFTYHLHHKAPDVIGPEVGRALGIPYVVAEASIAPKQRTGRWSAGYEQSVAAIRAADAIVFVNPVDVDEVLRVRGDVPHVLLRPFIDAARFALRAEAPTDGIVRLVTVAMMRDGAKLASYRVLADALTSVRELPWSLTVVGDGAARPAVEEAFARLPAGRVRFAGACDDAQVAALLHEAQVFVWPAVDEAFGMAFLEAQACGLPVVAGNAGGVASVVEDGYSGLLVPAGDPRAFAQATQRLVVDADLRRALGMQAAQHVRARHDVATAAATLDALLDRALACRQPRAPSATSC